WHIARFPRVSEKEQHNKEHGENAEGGDAENVFDAEMAAGQRSDIRAGSAADVHHGVVNGVADGADIFLGSASRRSHDARFDERNPQRRQNQDETDKNRRWNGGPHRSKPRRAQRPQQKVGGCEDEIGERKGAAKTKLVGNCAAKDGEEPNHAAENAGECTGLLGGEIQLLVKIVGERSESAVVREALEDFADVGDPEGPLETGTDLVQTLAEAHSSP